MAGLIELTEEVFDDLMERHAEDVCEECSLERPYPCPCDGYIAESERCLYCEHWENFCDAVERAKALLLSV